MCINLGHAIVRYVSHCRYALEFRGVILCGGNLRSLIKGVASDDCTTFARYVYEYIENINICDKVRLVSNKNVELLTTNGLLCANIGT